MLFFWWSCSFSLHSASEWLNSFYASSLPFLCEHLYNHCYKMLLSIYLKFIIDIKWDMEDGPNGSFNIILSQFYTEKVFLVFVFVFAFPLYPREWCVMNSFNITWIIYYNSISHSTSYMLSAHFWRLWGKMEFDSSATRRKQLNKAERFLLWFLF